MSDSTLTQSWSQVRLGDHTTVKARLGWKGLKAEEYVNDGYIFLATPNLKSNKIDFENVNYIPRWRYDESPEIQLREKDVLIVKDGSTLGICGYVRRLPRPATVNGSIAVVRVRKSLDSEFLFHFVRGNEFQKLIAEKKSGLGVPHLFQADLRDFPVSLPPVSQQRKIAEVLTTLDNLIERTEALTAKYEAIKQGMMHDLFTRGVDEHGQLRPPQTEAPHLYKQSPLAWIPKEWDCSELAKVVPHAEYGISVSIDDGEGTPVLRMNNLVGGGIDVTDIKFSRSSEASRLTLADRDVLFNRTNSIEHVGRTSLWRSELPVASFASYLVRLVPDLDKLLPKYLVYWLNLPETQIAIRRFATPGVHQVNINPTNLRRSSIRLPLDLEEQAAICRVIDQKCRTIEVERQYLAKLQRQRIGLMQDLLTGKVRVRVDDAEEVAHA